MYRGFTKNVLVPLALMCAVIAVLGFGGLKLAKVGGSSVAVDLQPSVAPTETAATEGPAAPENGRLHVIVLNGTATSGLAGKSAEALKRQGWTVDSVSNWTGEPLVVATVYYPPDYEADAAVLADQVGASMAVAPDSLSQTALTYVVVE